MKEETRSRVEGRCSDYIVCVVKGLFEELMINGVSVERSVCHVFLMSVTGG